MKQAFASRGEMFKAFRTPDGGFDREAMKKQMESPEGKSRMEQTRKQGEQLQDQTVAAIGKVLSKKQKDNFKKMQGKPFDLAKLGGPGSGGPGGPRANRGNAASTPNADATNKAKSESKSTTPEKKKGGRRGARKTSAAS